MKDTTTITIEKTLRDELGEMGTAKDTMNDVIKMLLNFYKNKSYFNLNMFPENKGIFEGISLSPNNEIILIFKDKESLEKRKYRMIHFSKEESETFFKEIKTMCNEIKTTKDDNSEK